MDEKYQTQRLLQHLGECCERLETDHVCHIVPDFPKTGLLAVLAVYAHTVEKDWLGDDISMDTEALECLINVHVLKANAKNNSNWQDLCQQLHDLLTVLHRSSYSLYDGFNRDSCFVPPETFDESKCAIRMSQLMFTQPPISAESDHDSPPHPTRQDAPMTEAKKVVSPFFPTRTGARDDPISRSSSSGTGKETGTNALKPALDLPEDVVAYLEKNDLSHHREIIPGKRFRQNKSFSNGISVVVVNRHHLYIQPDHEARTGSSWINKGDKRGSQYSVKKMEPGALVIIKRLCGHKDEKKQFDCKLQLFDVKVKNQDQTTTTLCSYVHYNDPSAQLSQDYNMWHNHPLEVPKKEIPENDQLEYIELIRQGKSDVEILDLAR